MAKKIALSGREFTLDLSAIHDAQQQAQYEQSFIQEESDLSITPRTFYKRTLDSIDVQNVIAKLDQTFQQTNTNFNNATTNEDFVNLRLISENRAKTLVARALKGKKYDDIKQNLAIPEMVSEATSSLDNLTKAKAAANADKNTNFTLFTDEYKNQNGTQVQRLGIVVDNELIQSITGFNQMIGGLKAPSISSISTGRSSKKSTSSSKSRIPEDTAKALHLVELALMEKALNEIANNQKPILVEIFARDPSTNEIVIDSATKHPEIHTILLHKMTGQNNQILILDPSSSEFSRHLTLGTNKLLLDCANNHHFEIIAPLKKLQIYKSIAATNGPNPDQGRDCIDIAVKLAFAINNSQDQLTDLKKITQWEPVIQISNDSNIDNFYTPISITRIKQSSEDSYREKYLLLNKKLKIIVDIASQIEQNLKFTKISFFNKYQKIMNDGKINCTELLLKNNPNCDNLISLYHEINEDIVSFLGCEQQIIDNL